MTREEIEELKGLAASVGLYDDKKPCKRAVILGKAIEALEQQPCEDAISRQAVIDVIERWLKCSGYNEAERHIMRAVQSVLCDSPSVNPQPKTGHWKKIATYPLYECSKCKLESMLNTWDYCPNCGCHMVEPQESEK